MQGLQATLTQLIKASESQTEAFESLKEDILLNIAGPAEDEEQSDSNRDSRLEINNAGVIERTTSGPGEFISSVFVRPKKDGSHRMILNLKQLNEYVTYRHFKMDTIQTALKRIRPGCFMASAVDLKDAYYSISVAEEHRIFIKFY